MADTLGWRGEFAVQVLPILLCAAVAFLVIPDDIGLVGGKPRRRVWDALGEFDFGGSAALTVATTSAILGLVSFAFFLFFFFSFFFFLPLLVLTYVRSGENEMLMILVVCF
jgi:hypothetical protein